MYRLPRYCREERIRNRESGMDRRFGWRVNRYALLYRDHRWGDGYFSKKGDDGEFLHTLLRGSPSRFVGVKNWNRRTWAP